jgi:hypothetical protein
MHIAIHVGDGRTYIGGETIEQRMPAALALATVRAVQYDTDAGVAEIEYSDGRPSERVPAHELDWLEVLVEERRVAKLRQADEDALKDDSAEKALVKAHREAQKRTRLHEAEGALQAATAAAAGIEAPGEDLDAWRAGLAAAQKTMDEAASRRRGAKGAAK